MPLSLTDLSTDILYNIFPHLTAAEFLSLTSSTKLLYDYRQDPIFWRVLTRKTFRIPPQPLLQADGARWQWLYKHLLTQTQLFTWGNNVRGNLGRRISPSSQLPRGPTIENLWPGRATIEDDVGIVADVQCGGWATFVLNSIGVIYVFGMFNGAAMFENDGIKRLDFPLAYPSTTASRYEPSTAIQQFSSGRSHVLGLADNGNVWYWWRHTAIRIRLSDMGISEENVVRVVAGWDRSSLYVNGTGIVYWPPPRPARNRNPDQADGGVDYLLVEPVIIPGTDYRRNRSNRVLETLASRIGVVTNHIILEGYIVFTTDHDKIFSYRTTHPIADFPPPEPVELTTFYSDSPSQFRIRDLQGSYRSFALFTTSGSVLTASCSLLDMFHLPSGATGPLPHPNAIPGLQGQSVISLAFGDHHFHALHSTGTITAYGTECQGCGSLGLGCRSASKLRGVRSVRGFGHDRRLKEGEGRTVWFDPMMHTWLQDMSMKGHHHEASERARMVNDGHEGACNAFAEYFEQEGRKWEEGLTAEGDLGAYFVLKVSAAGWHSAALVLVDETKAEMARQKHLVAPPIRSSPSNNEAVEPRFDWLAWFYMLLVYSVRCFLGLTARDEDTKGRRHRRRDEGHLGKRGEGSDGVAVDENQAQPVYTWAEDPFPRLRMADGEVMPGQIQITQVTG